MTEGKTMKRDNELILRILRYVRDNANDQDSIRMPDFNGIDANNIRYHAKLCIQAGYVEGNVGHRGMIYILSLTWQGHEYLEANCDC